MFNPRIGRRGNEQYIRDFTLPPSVMRKVTARHPELTPTGARAVERGLREWLICCGHRDGELLGMPSDAVDWAWHEFILNTPAYHAFCKRAYGEYLHHVPEADMAVPMRAGLRATVRAWDRSETGRAGEEATLWELDETLGLPEPIGITAAERRAARAEPRPARGRRGRWDGAAGAMYAGGGHAGYTDGGGGGCGGGCGSGG